MKKIFLIITAICCVAMSVKAEFVRPEAASQYAQGVLGMSNAPVPENEGSLRASGRLGQSVQPEYYVFNNPQGGWVIIAADDRVNPVIGYSSTGRFESSDIPDNLGWWMDGVADAIDQVREQDVQASAQAMAAWERIRRNDTPQGQKKEIRTALWSQDEPYNNLCPVVNGEFERSLTGCVATAMAIVMQSNGWPTHGKGVIGGYTTSTYPTYIAPYSIESHVYDWDIMSQEDVVKGKTDKWTQEQIFQVAQLMHDCGVAAEMDYSCEGSASVSPSLLKGVKNNMSYSKNASVAMRALYNSDEWFSLIKNEIDCGRAVYYGAVGEAGGHAFVCDGYETGTMGNQVRINWGWGGDYNGYYSLDLYIKAVKLQFNDDQEIIVGLAPDTTNVDPVETAPVLCYSGNSFYGIEPLVPADITLGGEVSFYMGWIRNLTERDLSLEFKVCLEDKDGQVKQEGWFANMNLSGADGYVHAAESDKTVLEVSPLLTDHFRLYYREKEGQWKPMPGNYDVLPNVEGIICGVIQDPVILVPDDCVAGQEIDLVLSLGFTHVKSVSWSVNGEAADDGKVKLVQGRNAIRADVEYLDESTGSIYRTLQIE